MKRDVPSLFAKIRIPAFALLLGAAGLLSGCQNALDGVGNKAEVPVPKRLIGTMKAKNMRVDAPIMLRIFKQENVLEIWKEKVTGRYDLLATYEICKWSGKLGPKFKEGDRQAPEGFYRVNKYQMNPNSQYHLSFNIGFPNAYDRAHGRTGSHLMVHGACSSAGCYSMTDEKVEIIYALARDAFRGGQKNFQVQAFPFRMTAKNMAKNRGHKDFAFWQMIKKGYDHFEITRRPPKVNVCEKRYEFNTDSKARYPTAGLCPARTMPASLATAYLSRQNKFQTEFEKLLAKSEKRKPAALEPLTFQTALPGVTVVSPKPKVVDQPQPQPADDIKKAGDTALETSLKPAG